MEIERKFLFTELPGDPESYVRRSLFQAYICKDPVIRVRKDDDRYELTVKGRGMLAREEHNMPITEEAFYHLLKKHDGKTIEKYRYLVPLEGGLTAEADVFLGDHAGKKMVEVEFESEEAASAFVPPAWFGEEVTLDPAWHNANMI